MAFYVVGPDGNKYGPADVPTLQQWVGEGRVTTNTLLEEEGTGRQGYASTVPGLSFAADGSADPMSGAPTYANSIPTQMPNAYVPNPQMNQPVQPLYGQQNPNAMPMTPGGVMGYSIPVNTSGTDGAVPYEISSLRWNWGAFLLPFFWALAMKKVLLALLMFIPVINFVVSIYLGINGHKIAWKSRRFDSIEQYFKVQTAWLKWGVGFMILWAILIVIDILLSINSGGSNIQPVGLILF